MRANNESVLLRNQCSFLVRIDGEELEIPINFGLSADEIRQLYPFILAIANTKVENPAIVFANETKYGKYNDASDEEYSDLLVKMKAQSKFWYDKPEASLLDIAVRFALDIKMKGIAELASIFEVVSPLESIKAEPISDAESDLIISRLHLETAADHMHDSGEKTLDSGVGGNNTVNIYNSEDTDEFFSEDLDKAVLNGTKFEKIMADNLSEHSSDEYINPINPSIADQIEGGVMKFQLEEEEAAKQAAAEQSAEDESSSLYEPNETDGDGEYADEPEEVSFLDDDEE